MNSIDQNIFQLAKSLPGGEFHDTEEPPNEALLLRQLIEYAKQQPLDMEQLPILWNILENMTIRFEEKVNRLELRTNWMVSITPEEPVMPEVHTTLACEK